jgi:hypothetical protein
MYTSVEKAFFSYLQQQRQAHLGDHHMIRQAVHSSVLSIRTPTLTSRTHFSLDPLQSPACMQVISTLNNSSGLLLVLLISCHAILLYPCLAPFFSHTTSAHIPLLIHSDHILRARPILLIQLATRFFRLWGAISGIVGIAMKTTIVWIP